MQNYNTINGALSIGALLCLAAGWLNLFSPEINDLLYNKLFYILIGASFALAAQVYPNKNHQYLAYAAAALCIIGAFLPPNLSILKTIGLFAGVGLSFIARQRRV